MLSYLILFATVAAVVLFNWIAHKIIIVRHRNLGGEKMFPRQLGMLGLTIASIILVVLVLPVDQSTRNQIIGLIGLVISGVFAFSSGNVFANLMAGLLLRVTRPFTIGDYIQIKDHFGRVTERGLFDTEIQNEMRELIAVPNTLLISNPISTIKSPGAIISVSLSIGYDVHHDEVEALLVKAASASGLENPFVNILELGNYAVVYRVCGVLLEGNELITARTKMFRQVLDTLHGNGVEIMSPSIMDQRRIDQEMKVIPKPSARSAKVIAAASEKIVFDKAELAAQKVKEQRDLRDQIEKLETSLSAASGDEKEKIKSRVDALKQKLEGLRNHSDENEES